MKIPNVKPVYRSERPSAVSRQLRLNSRQRRNFALPLLMDDDSETEPTAETGTGVLQADSYSLASDDASAILKEIKEEALAWPAQVATQTLHLREENDGYHG